MTSDLEAGFGAPERQFFDRKSLRLIIGATTDFNKLERCPGQE